MRTRDLQHPHLGLLEYDRKLDRWGREIPGSDVYLYLTSENIDAEEQLLEDATQLYRSFDDWCRRATERAQIELLPLKNDDWLSDGEGPVAVEEFRKRLRLECVTVYSKGDVEFIFGDGGLFAGHAVVVSGTIQEGPTAATLAG